MKAWGVQRVLSEVVLWSAFIASGGHVVQVAMDMGNHWLVAAFHAIGLDGLVYVGISAILAGRRGMGVTAVVYGGGMSLAFNAASYSATGMLPPWLIAASMPVSLILAVIVGHGTATARPKPLPLPIEEPAAPIEIPAAPLIAPAAHVEPPMAKLPKPAPDTSWVRTAEIREARKPRPASADGEKAMELLLAGRAADAVADGLMGRSTMDRYVRVHKTLAADLAAEIPAEWKVRGELVEILRRGLSAPRVEQNGEVQ